MTSSPSSRTIVSLLLLAVLLIGIAQAALLPPFEGIDETAHYSYIQQLAETGRWTRRGDTMSKDIENYVKIAPTGMDRANNYLRFFSSGADAIEAVRAVVHTPPPQPRAWQPGEIKNWQAQHPPLYYLAMVPAYRLSENWGLGSQLLFMRIVSYVLAWGALSLAAFAALRAHGATNTAPCVAYALALWPALFPMWFPEMARLGNDSLIILIVSGISATVAALTFSAGIGLYALLGLLLGLGLLTKAILLPVAAATSVFLVVHVFWARADAALLRRRLFGLAAFALITSAICGWWYMLQFIETGTATGSHDIVQMNASGGMLAGLRKYFYPFDLARVPWAWAMSFLWGSTWSFVVPPRAAMIGLGATAIALGFGCYWTLRRRPLAPLTLFALLTLAFFLAALTYHTAVVISFDNGISPMWYLHAFAPILAPLVAAGIAGLLSLRYGRGIATAVVGYPLAFLALGIAVNALYFAGCGTPLLARIYFVFSSARECAGNLAAIYANLSVLSYPRLATVMFAVGWLLYAAGALLALRHLAKEAADRTRAVSAG